MQLNVEIDKVLLEKAMILSGLADESIILQAALNLFIKQQCEQQVILTEMSKIAQRCASLPDVDQRSEAEILGYNEMGLLVNGD